MYFHCLIVFYMFCFWWLAVIFQQNSPNYILLTCNTMFVLIFLLSVFLKMKFFLLSFLLVSFKSWFLFVIWKRIMNNRIKFLLKTRFICLSGCNEWKTPLEPCAICGVVSLSFIFRSVLGEFRFVVSEQDEVWDEHNQTPGQLQWRLHKELCLLCSRLHHQLH